MYPKIATDLNSRLPLRNLNWNSQARPLRSIESLFVDIVPDDQAAHGLARSTSHDDQTATPRSLDQSAVHKERRHQIPGLRSTPYLRIYLLRCDDAETYKTTSRKALREWIKSRSSSSHSKGPNNQENHDAFEWLIVHIAPVEGASWPTKVSAIVLDKIKSDFNGSSKSSIDRVAQIPCAYDIPGGNSAEAVQPGPAREQFLKEANRGWDDLLTKFKALILASFDSRVRQYEEDIKEKGSQRNIPGWNFCTFFVLKEGLARGFESVGLLEDALMGYDELSVELLSAMRIEEEKAMSVEGASLFRDSTEELLAEAKIAIDGNEDARVATSGTIAMSLDADRKPFRELILANNISVYEFRSYVFARQIAVLRRIASLSGLSSGTSSIGKPSADPAALAEICYRATSFVASNSRTVRQDLRCSLNMHRAADASERATKHDIVENMVASWSYHILQQILTLTNDTTLSRELDLAGTNSSSLSLRQQSNQASTQASPHPARSSSFATRPQSISLQQPNTDGFSEQTATGKIAQPHPKRVALCRLASQRAELFLLSRRALSNIGDRNQWHTGWKSLAVATFAQDMDEVSLQGPERVATEDPLVKAVLRETSFRLSILGESLQRATESRDFFNESYENLSWLAHNSYQFSGDEKSVHGMIADIATLRFHLGDYNTAAAYFHELAPFYADQNWSELELAILDMYAGCLKELGKSEDYVRIGLKLLAKITMSPRHDLERRNDRAPSTHFTTVYPSDHVRSILAASKALKEPCLVHLRNYFLDVTISQHIEHLPGKDGFSLKVSLRHILDEELDAIFKVRLISASEGQNREIWLSSGTPVKLRRGRVFVDVTSSMLFPDRYLVDRLLIQSDNVIFQHDFAPRNGGIRPESRDSASCRNVNIQTEPIVVWAPKRSLKITATARPDMHLEQPRAVVFTLASGDDPIDELKLHVKAATAGLRMYTSDAAVVNNDDKIIDKSQAGIVAFGPMAANSLLKVAIPFQMDTEFKQMLLRSEVTYVTAQGTFVCGDSHPISIILPLGVNVQDIFKSSELYSRFSVSCSTAVPLSVLSYTVNSTRDFEATTSGGHSKERISVFSKQPMSMVYRIVRKKDAKTKGQLQTRLSMRIEYQCLDEEIIAAAQNCLVSSISGGELDKFRFLLSSHLLSMLREKLPAQDLELIGLLREIGLAPYSEFHWDKILGALSDQDRPHVVEWLDQWHKACPCITF